MTLQQFITSIDYSLLKEQKKFLVQISPCEFDEKIDGLLGLIDEIQGIAVHQFGYKESDVFMTEDDLNEADNFSMTLKANKK